MSDKFGITYDLEEVPPPIQVAEYEANCNRQYAELLSGDPSESEIQSFLERRPCLVPGHSMPAGRQGHYPLHCGLISQPKLQGLVSYVPDFMWISTHSGAWFPTLIEIEKPSKRIFTKRGRPTHEFTEARHQLAEWRTWFKNPVNVEQFMDSYGVPARLRWRTMVLHMILIYGRRAEFEDDPKLTGQISSLLPGDDEELMTFDRLRADLYMKNALTLRATGFGKYRAHWVPPVFETEIPELAERFLHLEGMAEAIDQNDELEAERKDFLKRRVVYWKEWAASPGSVRLY